MRIFKLKIPDEMLRRMNRKQYYGAMSWLRYVTRELHNRINWNEFNEKVKQKVTELTLYGQAKIH